jgi:hypothetical protein
MSKNPYVVKMTVEVEVLSDIVSAETPEDAIRKVYFRTDFKKLLDNSLGDANIVSTEWTGTVSKALAIELNIEDNKSLHPEEVTEFDGQSLSTAILKGLPTKY